MGMMISPMMQLQAQEVNKDDILGIWFNQEKDTIMVYKKDTIFLGKIVALEIPNDSTGKPRTDIKNPKPDLKKRKLKGLTFLEGCEFDHGEWKGCDFYDYTIGKRYPCKMKLMKFQDPTEDTLNIINLAGERTTYWTKKKPSN